MTREIERETSVCVCVCSAASCRLSRTVGIVLAAAVWPGAPHWVAKVMAPKPKDKPTGPDPFKDVFLNALAKLRRGGRGCRHCATGQCYEKFRTCVDLLVRHRQEFRALSREAQDQQLLWMFMLRSRSKDPQGTGKRTRESTDASLPEAKQARTSPDRVPTTPESEPRSNSERPERVLTTTDEDHEPERIPTTAASESESLDVESHRSEKNSQALPEAKRVHHRVAKRAPFQIEILGQRVCNRASTFLMGVGCHRLVRVQRELADGRKSSTMSATGPLHPNAKKTRSVLSFLWRIYHSAGESMPDKFSFARRDARTLVIEPTGAKTARVPANRRTDDEEEGEDVSSDEEPRDLEEEERNIAAAVLYAESAKLPSEAALFGPGMLRGPCRYLPPTRRLYLYWEYVAWCADKGLPSASFATFLRAFSSVQPVLRIRKAGQHATCDTCLKLKHQIRRAKLPAEKHMLIEALTQHNLDQWLDRQVWWHQVELSLQLSGMLAQGYRLLEIARNLSQLSLIVDGIDQAKFRLPRVLDKGKALDTLLRPALHVQGVWCNGFGYHLAVSDADMKKDTNNNIETIARMLSSIKDKHGGLPMGLHIQQDNTSRECKNQFMLSWAAKLVALGVFAWVTLAYLITGHTHENIDGTFGQITVKLSAKEFDDDLQVIQLLEQILADIGIDARAKENTLAYKLDESADWRTWLSETQLSASRLTGPQAPHFFRICRLKDIGRDLLSEVEGAPGMPAADMDDVVMVVRARMASPEPQQVLRLIPATTCRTMVAVQPSGYHTRRSGGDAVKAKVARVARVLHDKGAISTVARDYLVGWATGTRDLAKRPPRYSFLDHRPGMLPVPAGGLLRPPRQAEAQRVEVRVRGVGGEVLPVGPDDDDAEPGELVERAGAAGLLRAADEADVFA